MQGMGGESLSVIENGPSGLKFISGGSGLIDILNIEKNSIFQVIYLMERILGLLEKIIKERDC